MARPLRLEYSGAVYHVMARGHERSAVFRDDGHREKFRGLLGSVSRDEGWEIHGYCLMGNHYHLLVETPLGKLSRGIKAVNGRYAQWFNRRHGRRGHFWEARFRSVLVQKESHLLELHRYIVLNPVRARLVERARDWRWSSYRATAGLEAAPDWLAVDWTLSQFARGRSTARGAFRRFVARGSSSKEIKELEKSGLLGDREFRRRIQEMLEGREIADEIPLRYRHPMEIEMDQIRREVAKEWRVSEGALAKRRAGDEKKAAIYLAKKLIRLGGREVGAAFGVKAAQVSHVIRAIDDVPTSPLARRIEGVRRRLLRA
ncbi:MAG TPA: transposase [Thermoanaerobaculia bacterium]|nr:transposase [Thermoanaerobaculia bacterium]